MKPHPYQEEGAAFLAARERAYLADEPGLGKTLQVKLAWEQVGRPRVRVACPAIGRTMWREMLGPEALVESYSRLVTSDAAREAFTVDDETLLVLDEAHMLGSASSRRTQLFLRPTGLARRAGAVWLLSGTPLRGGVSAMFPALAGLWPGLLREHGIQSFQGYLNYFTRWVERRWGVTVYGARNVEAFRAMLARFMLRRTQAEVLPQLPPLTWERLPLDGDATDLAALDEEGHGALLAQVQQGEVPGGDQTSRVRRLVGLIKAPLSARRIEDDLEASAGKVFVSAYHLDVLDYLEKRLAPYGVARVDGGTPPAERDARMARFRTDAGCRVFLGQIMATNTTITLTAAALMHMVEPTWDADDNEQQAKRLHRLGQERPVVIKVHVLADTIDDAVERVWARKLATRQAMLA